jgi:hypothetical protein
LVDHASSFIFLVNQCSLRVGETLQSKIVRTVCWNMRTLKSFRADNMPFASKEFQADLDTKGQEITSSGVGAHHHNGVAERAIQTVAQWARSMLLHQALHWPEQTQLDLWPFAFGTRSLLMEPFTKERFIVCTGGVIYWSYL